MAALSAEELEQSLERFLSSLRSERLVYFPIRHHSPSCSRQLRRLIADEKPALLLIEGPPEMTRFIPFLFDPRTKAPIAVYSTYNEQRADEEPLILGGYFPLCDYSPELVALREGARVGAQLRFIDLSYAEHVLASRSLSPEEQRGRLQALQEERYLQQSRYLRELARKSGCRDQDELWDHLFELRGDVPRDDFIREVATYCYMTRLHASEVELAADGTLAREEAMAIAIREALTNVSGKIVVVTGGFHTAVLPALVEAKTFNVREAAAINGRAEQYLVRYSFDQLDALNGYAAGMPSPAYYDQLWSTGEDAAAMERVVAEIIVAIGRRTREEKMAIAVSPADEIAAFQQALLLASFRGHAGAGREDLLDALRSCFVKGSMDAEGAALMRFVREVLAGHRIGEVPPESGSPPIVDDFRRRAAALRLKIDDSEAKTATLELYRKANHRRSSRFLHSVSFLQIPFGRMVAGPDFASGRHLERLQEIWDYRWSPMTESALVERSKYGATIEEAASAMLREKLAHLSDEGKNRNAAEAVRLLIIACRMGLHELLPAIVVVIAAQISDDPSFISLAAAVNELMLLDESREPLEAHGLLEIDALATTAYQKACYLVPELSHCADEELNEVLRSLLLLSAVGAGKAGFDSSLFHEALQRLMEMPPPSQSLLEGAATALLFAAARMDEGSFLAKVDAALLTATGSATRSAAFVRGVLMARRELAWNLPALLQRIDRVLAGWEDDAFLAALPEMRLAFSSLTPRETDHVAGQVASFLGVGTIGSLGADAPIEDVALHASIDALLREALRSDGLGSWIEEEKRS